MRSFRHVNARSVEEACELLKTHGRKARLNAGGTDLIGALKDDIFPDAPEVLVNLKTVPGLDAIREEDGGFSIGALARLSRIQASPLVREKLPLLAASARSVGTPQLRNMGTLGGNLCQDVRCWYFRYPRHVGGPIACLRKGSGGCLALKGDNRYHAILGGKRCYAASPSDTATALVALDAVIRAVGPEGKREIAVSGFHTSLGTVLRPEEVVTEVWMPAPPANARQTFLKFTLRKAVDFAVASVAAVVNIEDGVCTFARIALGAVAPIPIRATAAERMLLGRPLTEETAAEAAELALAKAKPLSGNGYKIEIAKSLMRQALCSPSPGDRAASASAEARNEGASFGKDADVCSKRGFVLPPFASEQKNG